MSKGASQVLRTDYGGFNPRFIGLTFLFDSPEEYNLVFSYLTDSPMPTGAPLPPSISDLHQIALLSVVDHENRHYVDFLLSPYSMTLFRMRMQAMINGIQVISDMREMAGDVVPVPLARWVSLDGLARAAYTAEWSSLLGRKVVPIELPVWSLNDFMMNKQPTVEPIEEPLRIVEAAVGAYVRIEQLTRGFDASAPERYFRPSYVHEASALTIQLAAVLKGQGTSEFGRLMRFLMDSETPQGLMWQTCFKLARLIEQSGGGVTEGFGHLICTVRRILTITTWSMLGNYQLDGPTASAAHRLYCLLNAVVDNPSNARWSCDMDSADSVQEMWDHWDEATGASTGWADSLDANLAMTKGGVAQYERLRAHEWGSIDALDAVVAVAREVSMDQETVANTFFQDVLLVVDPFKYVLANLDRFPRTDIRLQFQGFGVDPAAVTAGRPLFRQLSSGEQYVSGIVFSRPEDDDHAAMLDKKLLLETLMEWCDVLFSNLQVPDDVAASARSSLATLMDKRTLQIL